MIGSEPPVTPDPDRARQWLEHELAKGEYHQHPVPRWFTDLGRAIENFLQRISDSTGLPQPIALLVLLAVVAVGIAAVVYFFRPRLSSTVRSDRQGIFDSATERSAAEHRARADAAAAADDYATAIVERFRAMVRQAEERVLITPQSGRTASEFSRELAARLGGFSQRTGQAAELFNSIRYRANAVSATGATVQQYRWLAELEDELRAAAPATSTPRTGASRSWASPR